MISRIVELYKFKEWLEERAGIADSTIYAYFHILKGYFAHYEGDPLDIDNLNWFLAEHSYKKRSTYYYSAIRKYIDFKLQNHYQKREEIKDKLLKPKRFKDIKVERKNLKDKQLIKILNNIQDQHHTLIALLQMQTASRAGGILNIRRNGVQMEEYQGKNVMRIATTEKGGKRNVVYLFDPISIQLMKEYLEYFDSENLIHPYKFFEDYIFIMVGNVWTSATLANRKRTAYNRYLLDLKKAIELSKVVNKKLFATHDFRRCFARKAWIKYKDVNVLQRALNHEDPSTTLRYLKHSGLQNIDVFKEMQG